MFSALGQHPSRGRHVAPQGPAQEAHAGAAGHHDLQGPRRSVVLLGIGRLALRLHREERVVRGVGFDLARLLLLRALAGACQPQLRGARRYSVSPSHSVLCPLQHQVPPSGNFAVDGVGDSVGLGLRLRDCPQSGLRLLGELLEHRCHAQQLHRRVLALLGVRLPRRRHAVDLVVSEVLARLLVEAPKEGIHSGAHGAEDPEDAFRSVDPQLLLPSRGPSRNRGRFACRLISNELAG
mmetsp:Transcript_86617/g.258501  ORF Transcript_86617/g.258501 Transcript_86617/m.258501 type:complete len:237 (-) Transcript_86617:860-1570(-)